MEPATVTTTTTMSKLGHDVLATVTFDTDQPWSSFAQEAAFDVLFEYLQCLAKVGPNASCNNANALVPDRRRKLFVYDHAVLHDAEVQALAKQALCVLLDSDLRISTADLRRLFDRILPADIRLPFFIRRNDEPWSWFVFDDLGTQEQWQSVRVWYTLHRIDTVALRGLYPPWTAADCQLEEEEDREFLTEELGQIATLVHMASEVGRHDASLRRETDDAVKTLIVNVFQKLYSPDDE